MRDNLTINEARLKRVLVGAASSLFIATMMAVLAGVAQAAGPSPMPEPKKVSPILERVADHSDGTYIAYFGYKNPNAFAVTIPIETNGKSNLVNNDHVSDAPSGMAVPLAQGSYTYTIALPGETFVVMGNQMAGLPFTVANDAGSGGNIDSVKIGVPPSIYWISTATMAPDGWRVTEIKNAGAGQAWVHFEAITAANAIEPGEDATFNVIMVGNQFGVFPSSDKDETDALDFVIVEGTTTFTRSGSLPGWERKALAVNLSASPSSLAVGSLVTITMNVSNRSTITQTSVVPTTVVSGSGGATLATGPTPAELSILSGETASFTWTYTATASGDVVFGNSASDSVASSPSEQSNTVLIGNFTAALNLEPTQVISGQLTTVNMAVKNNETSAITNVTPSALSLLGTATMTLSSGPTPSSVASLDPGATASFEWVYTATGSIGATYQFTGTASAGSGITSNVATSPQGVIKKYNVSVTPRYAAIGTMTQTLEYVVANNGGSPVKLVEFTLPSDFTYNAGNASGGYGGNWDVTKDGTGNPKIIRFEAPTIPTDTLPIGSLAAFSITFSALPSSATDYFFPVRIQDTDSVEKTENVAVTMTEYEVAVEASPSSGIYADGVSTSVITATVTFSGSVQSGQTVNFYTTKGVLSSETGVTNGSGVVTTTLTAPLSSRDTSALVTASCNGAQDEVVVYYIGSYALTVSVTGNGSVAKSPDQPGYHYGDVVTLTATADLGWSFDSWSGDLVSTTNPVTIAMTTQKAVAATFTQNEYTLTVNLSGSGSVDKDPASPYYYGDVVTLTATADPGWTFADWSGDLVSTTNPVTITMTANKIVTATFIPTVGFSSATYSVGEGDGTATVTVTLSAASGLTATVDYATSDGTAAAGEDYTAASGTLTFTPGITTQTFSVSITNDSLYENDETVSLTLSDPVSATLGTSNATLTIEDDDSVPTVSFSSATYSVGEGDGTAVITVTLSAASEVTATVDYATSDGTATAGSDYTAASGTLTFTPGTTVQTFTVDITNDTLDEYDETVDLTLSDPSNATIAGTNPATLTIEDNDDPPTISINDVAVTEGDAGTTDAVFTVTLSAASGELITVDYAMADGTATAGNDYTAISTTTLNFPAGTTVQTITVQVMGDTQDEGDETFFVNLDNPTKATIADNQGVGTITGDDAPAPGPGGVYLPIIVCNY